MVSIIKPSYKKIPPPMIKNRGFKKFWNEHFKNSLNEDLANKTEWNYNSLEEIVLLSSQALLKKGMVRTNQRLFMNKEIYKTLMVRGRLRNILLKEKLYLAEKHIISKETTGQN